jgi:hypothetical protein
VKDCAPVALQPVYRISGPAARMYGGPFLALSDRSEQIPYELDHLRQPRRVKGVVNKSREFR